MPKVTEYGKIVFRLRVGRFKAPAQAGLHPDVEYFKIPAHTETVDPRWYDGGYIETENHGRNMNAVKIDRPPEPVPNQNKPMGQYQIHALFDWDESNTFLNCNLFATENYAVIRDIDPEGEPDVGWV